MAASAGLVCQIGDELSFLPASIALRVIEARRISRVPASELGMIWLDGGVAPVLRLGPPTTEMVVCDLNGETWVLSGARVLEVGSFPTCENGIRFADNVVGTLDFSKMLITESEDT